MQIPPLVWSSSSSHPLSPRSGGPDSTLCFPGLIWWGLCRYTLPPLSGAGGPVYGGGHQHTLWHPALGLGSRIRVVARRNPGSANPRTQPPIHCHHMVDALERHALAPGAPFAAPPSPLGALRSQSSADRLSLDLLSKDFRDCSHPSPACSGSQGLQSHSVHPCSEHQYGGDHVSLRHC